MWERFFATYQKLFLNILKIDDCLKRQQIYNLYFRHTTKTSFIRAAYNSLGLIMHFMSSSNLALDNKVTIRKYCKVWPLTNIPNNPKAAIVSSGALKTYKPGPEQ